MKLQDQDLFKQSNFLFGGWVDNESGQLTEVLNPFDSRVIGSVPNAEKSQVLQAIDEAQVQFKAWKQQTAETRANVLRRWHHLMVAHADDLASIITAEQGKPLAEAKGEVLYAASYVEWFAEEARRANGTIIPSHKNGAQVLTTKEPIGVVAAITPWNFPAAMIARKCAPAFAAGCSVILKPAPDTPFTALALAELADRAGLPKGLFQVVTGDAVMIGELLTKSPVVKKLSFTGSTKVGKLLMQQSASNIKKLSLELGGNAPFIVFEDADIDAAVEGAIAAKYRNAGQTCVCANRIYVQAKVYGEFLEKFTNKVGALRAGNGFEEGVKIGPLINEAAVNKVQNHVQDALGKGAHLRQGVVPQDGERLVAPIVLSDMTDDMIISKEETFGPVAPLFKFETEEEVIARANNTEFGLASYFYTQSLSRAWRVSAALESGMVGVNEGIISTATAPFGGVKESGLGREGSQIGLDDYLETKYVLMGGLS
ncbi:NAD-dependent succinate-semialdehyde dehydrogenase [Vibrio maerlii]|uniref:NAD-dependent succinate-semialdehyde dehydrogenase n=1 Tax=Vibrio maerlii TaxID=2231648 RepID=UPI000E3D9201|nr:NAD-dependent succinate-semialdehyde dehydrogenase [Vibrio maerlii]